MHMYIKCHVIEPPTLLTLPVQEDKEVCLSARHLAVVGAVQELQAQVVRTLQVQVEDAAWRMRRRRYFRQVGPVAFCDTGKWMSLSKLLLLSMELGELCYGCNYCFVALTKGLYCSEQHEALGFQPY